MATLAEIRAKLQAQNSKPSGEGSIGDNAIYPHWNIPENSESDELWKISIQKR